MKILPNTGTSQHHTREPWWGRRLSSDEVIMEANIDDGEHQSVRQIATLQSDSRGADAERIVACVNACQGIADPSVVPELNLRLVLHLRALLDALEDFSNEYHNLTDGEL